MPLTKSFQLSGRPGYKYWIKPELHNENTDIEYKIQQYDDDVPSNGTVDRYGATCVACGATITTARLRSLGKDVGKIGNKLVATIARVHKKRVFVTPDDIHTKASIAAVPSWRPIGQLPLKARSISPQLYGYTNWSDLFSNRQLVFLTTISDLIKSFIENCNDGYDCPPETRRAVGVYLTLALGRATNYFSTFNYWYPAACQTREVFGRQGIPMVWNYGEVNPFAGGSRDWIAHVDWVADVVQRLQSANQPGLVMQSDASKGNLSQNGHLLITDPPYYDNIHYSDSSDFFYVWHRAILRDVS